VGLCVCVTYPLLLATAMASYVEARPLRPHPGGELRADVLLVAAAAAAADAAILAYLGIPPPSMLPTPAPNDWQPIPRQLFSFVPPKKARGSEAEEAADG